MLKRDLAKSVIAAVSLILVIAIVAAYILPQYVYISPFSAIYVNGIVDHKKIGHASNDGVTYTIYQISVTVIDDDPLNNLKSGNTLGYVFSESDWNLVEWGDTVKIRVFPNAKAEIVKLYPALEPAPWLKVYRDGLNTKLTADNRAYSPNETVNFTLTIENFNQSEALPYSNKTLSIFKTFTFWVYNGAGNQVYSSSANVASETQEVYLPIDQMVNYNFQWSIGNLPAGYYTVRVYAGYFTNYEEATLTGTQTIQVT